MTVQNGDLANQTEFNTSFMSREDDTSTVGKVDLLQADTTSIPDVQNFINALRTYVGQIIATTPEGDVPPWATVDPDGNIIGASTDTIIDKIVAIVLAFSGSTGHDHSGADGQGPKIDLVSAVNGILNPVNGGTGLDASLAPDGSLLIGNAAGFTLATITGTANQVTVTNGTGTITLSLPQDIDSGATPSFVQVTLAGDPASALQAATKQYVDNLVQGLNWKQNVRVATIAAGTLATDFENGDTIDGVVLATGNRILIKDQTSGDENGIYIVEATGAPTRSADANTFEELNSAAVFVSEGTVNADKGFQQTVELTIITDPQTWVQSFGTGLYQVNGQALQELSARVFSLVIDGSTLTQSASGLKVADGAFASLTATQTFSGDTTFSGILKIAAELCFGTAVDSTSTGASADLIPTTPVVELTNASLTSVASLLSVAPTDACAYIIVNRTGAEIDIEHNNGTPAANGFQLIDGVALPIANDQAVMAVYSLDADRWIIVGGTGSGTGGSGSGGINYILNPDAEIDLTGWIKYTNTPPASPNEWKPVDGTGGAVTIIFSLDTTSLLRGVNCFRLAKAGGVNRQGAGVSYDFTIDPADKAKVLRASFDYTTLSANFEFNSGTPTDPSDVVIFVYDVTNGVLIETTNPFLDGSGRYITEFQTSADSVEYRLILNIATTSTLSWEFFFDNIQVGPRDIAKGYSPNKFSTKYLSADVTTNITDIADLRFTNLIVGKTYRATLHARMYITDGDAAVMQANHDGNLILITSVDLGAAATDDGDFRVTPSGLFVATTNTLTFDTLSLTFSYVYGDGTNSETHVVLEELNDYEGGTTVSQSTDFGSRVIAGNFYRNAAQSIPDATDTTVILDSTTLNTGGLSLNTGTGVVTIQESGLYNLIGQTRVDSLDDLDRNICRIRVNGISVAEFTSYSANANDAPTSTTSTISQLMAGDEVVLVVYQDSGTSNNLSNSSVRTFLAINKIQSPQTLMGGEVVAARYTTNAGQLIPNTLTYTVVNFDDKVFDTHNAVTIGASWRFTAPISGKYSVDAKLELGSSNWTAENAFQMNVFKEGVDYARIGDWRAIVTYTNGIPALINGATTVDLDAGEYIDVQTRHNGDSGSVGLAGASIVCYIDIFKVN